MSNERRAAGRVTTGACAALLAVILINVVPRLVTLPDIDLPAISLPDVPGWIHTVVKAKNWLLAGLVVVLAATTLLSELGKRR